MIGEIRQNFTEASASVGLILATALVTRGGMIGFKRSIKFMFLRMLNGVLLI